MFGQLTPIEAEKRLRKASEPGPLVFEGIPRKLPTGFPTEVDITTTLILKEGDDVPVIQATLSVDPDVSFEIYQERLKAWATLQIGFPLGVENRGGRSNVLVFRIHPKELAPLPPYSPERVYQTPPQEWLHEIDLTTGYADLWRIHEASRCSECGEVVCGISETSHASIDNQSNCEGSLIAQDLDESSKVYGLTEDLKSAAKYSRRIVDLPVILVELEEKSVLGFAAAKGCHPRPLVICEAYLRCGFSPPKDLALEALRLTVDFSKVRRIFPYLLAITGGDPKNLEGI